MERAEPANRDRLCHLFTPTEGSPVRNDNAQGDLESDNEMWNIYLKAVEDIHKPSMDAWKEDSNGVIVLAALFSAIVGAFIIESYKKLSPDNGDQTVTLLKQISQQLADFSLNGTNPAPSLENQPSFSPGASILWVNGLWLVSLVLSITSALHSTLLQEWARTYTQMPQLPIQLSHRARVTSFLWSGFRKYNPGLASWTAQALLHVAVLLFFTGLVIFFFTIHRTMAIVVLILVTLFALAYFMLTILRLFDPKCPYDTPMTLAFPYPLYIMSSFVMLCLRWAVKGLGGNLMSYNLGQVTTPRQRKVVEWLEVCFHAVKSYRRQFKIGAASSLIFEAHKATVDVDRKALAELFHLLDTSKTSKLVASIPKDKIVELVTPPIKSGNSVIDPPLLTLLRSCARGTRAAGVDKVVRQNSMLVFLHAVHHIAKTFIARNGASPSHARSLLNKVRTNFANIGLMRPMWDDVNATIRVTSRSICALLAKYLLHIHSLTGRPLEAPELVWLQDVFGETLSATHDTTTLELMNLKSFVYGVLLHQQGDLTTEDAISFTETLLILMNAGVRAPFRRDIFQEQLSALIGRIQQDGLEGSAVVVDKLRRIFHDFLYPQAQTPAPAPACGPELL
ncbi:hypothetical protein F5148DRAFT_56910 [Russula earlei]|uniref:Uncharacterized protein n=1 Tax=Russula earlei TaxID=71964 RepID=A0ACC0ULP2_9AGAM|nr:hypothetical protein F5148DRAFT_56910 [Russula earlei]